MIAAYSLCWDILVLRRAVAIEDAQKFEWLVQEAQSRNITVNYASTKNIHMVD
jgi:hypothetical protein